MAKNNLLIKWQILNEKNKICQVCECGNDNCPDCPFWVLNAEIIETGNALINDLLSRTEGEQ